MTIAIRIAPAMNPGNFPLDAPGVDTAAIENTASAATLPRENNARASHRGLSPATFRRSLILLLHTSRSR
jgi:hypothetical protein